MATNPIELLKAAFHDDDARRFGDLLHRFPEFKTNINEPVAAFDAPLVTQVRSREMLDTLLAAGADIDAKSRWWAGGFGLLHTANPALATYAIERGAHVDIHAAARLGLIDEVHEFLRRQPELTHARGGDGQTPLHFASTIDIAALLLNYGADINARDIDHESTPAQYMIRDRQPIARYLVGRGCGTDVLMAAALGDEGLVRNLLKAEPNCVRMRVNADFFPMRNKRAGGTIYQWTLGFHVSAYEIAKNFGHTQIADLIFEHSPDDVKLVLACWTGDEARAKLLLEQQPSLVRTLADADRRQVADAARNNNTDAVRLMLACGWPPDIRGQHGGTPLHWAGFHGNVEMAREILRFRPDLESIDFDFKATPLGWAIHGSEHGWYCRTGNYAATAEALLHSGATCPQSQGGTPAVREVLARCSQGRR